MTLVVCQGYRYCLGIIPTCDIFGFSFYHRLFRPAGITKYYTDKRSVFKLLCAKKALDVINECNILDHKSEKSKILLFRLSHIPILHILQLRYSTTNRCWMILTLMTSSINLLIALVEVSYSYIFRIPMVYIVRLTLCTKC